MRMSKFEHLTSIFIDYSMPLLFHSNFVVTEANGFLTANFLIYMQVLLHEGGTLLVCLNSIRALKDPSWSWRQDICNLLNELKKSRRFLLRKLNTTSNTIQAAPL